MASQFDLLLSELNEHQAANKPPKTFKKALPPHIPTFTLADAAAFAKGMDMARDLGAKLKVIAKSLSQDSAANRKEEQRKEFFKALGTARAGLGRRIAAGTIGVDDAIKVEATLNRMADRALQIIAAEGA